jgi:Sulfotransferase family
MKFGSSWQETHEELTASGSWSLLNYMINISLKNRYVYCEMPKAACSTIKTRLHRLELLDLPQLKIGPHPEINASPFVKPYQVSVKMLHEIMTGPDFFRFTFVRNPFVRLLSGYLDKVIQGEPESEQIVRGSALPSHLDISFRQFLEVVESIPNTERDKHWRTQISLLPISTADIQLIGRVESFEPDFAKLGKRLNVSLGKQDHRPHQTGASSRIAKYYDPYTTSLAIEIASDDFSAFGYPRSLPPSLE